MSSDGGFVRDLFVSENFIHKVLYHKRGLEFLGYGHRVDSSNKQIIRLPSEFIDGWRSRDWYCFLENFP